MSFKDYVNNPEMVLRFYVRIQGLKYVFLSSETPKGHNGAAWAAPSGYTVLESVFDASDIQDTGCDVSRLDGSAQPASMLIRLIDDRAYQLGSIFAWDGNGAIANLTADFGHATGTGPYTMTVDDTTNGFSSSGDLFFGRETVSYDSKTSTTFNVTTRNKYDPVGDGDDVYIHNSFLPGAARTVSDFPRAFIGRYVSVMAYWVTASGHAVDTAYDGSASFECFRGIIRESPRPGAGWHSYEFEIEGIDSILRTQVGIESKKGNLVLDMVPFTSSQGVDGQIPPQSMYVVTEAISKIHFRVVEIATGQEEFNGEVEISTNTYTETSFFEEINTKINAALATATSSASVSPVARLKRSSGGKLFILSTLKSNNYAITYFFDRPQSVGPILNFFGTHELVGAANITSSAKNAPAAFIHQHSTAIPFSFSDDNELTLYDPPQPGFAVIGSGDKVEIIQYDSIGSTSIPNLHVLTGCVRGLMGTGAQEHVVTFEQAAQKNKGEDIRFGVGFLETSFFDAVLQLAISTGTTAHHGEFDLLAAGSGAPQAPGHFDTANWKTESQALLPTERTISYFMSKPEALSDFIKDLLTPVGRFVFPRVNDAGEYRIAVGRNKPPIPAQSKLTLTTDVMDWSNPATYQRGRSSIVTGVTVFPVWDYAEEEPNKDVKVTIINADAESTYGQRNIIEWTLRGYQVDAGQCLELTKSWAAQLAERHGRDRVVLELTADRAAWFVNVGDTVTLTLPNIPTPDGTRGLSSHYAVVENIVKIWSGPQPGAIITVVVESSNFATQYRPYSPSGKVASKAGTTITLEANEYSSSGGAVDASFFQPQDHVVIHNEGDYSSRETHVVESVSGNVITLSYAVTLTVGSYTAIDFEDFGNLDPNDDQRNTAAFIADSSHQLSDEEGHRYT